MKRVSITLPDDFYEHIAKMENKSEYIRELILRDMKQKTEERSSSDIEEMIQQHERRMAKALRLAEMLNKRTMAKLDALSRRLDELESQLIGSHTPAHIPPVPPEVGDEPITPDTTREGMSSPKNIGPRDEVFACVPKNTPIRRSALESMLSKRLDGAAVHAALDELIASGLVNTKVENGEEYVWR